MASLRTLLLDPVECSLCLLNARREVVTSSTEARRLLEGGRTKAFTESYSMLSRGMDLLAGVKDQLNRMALDYRPSITGYRGLLALIARANSVDWRLPGYNGLDLEGGKRSVLVDDSAVSLLQSAERVVIALDNAGEAVIDLRAAGWLAERGHLVSVLAREYPYEVDVTATEARALAETLGLEGIEVVSTGSRYPPLYLPGLSRDALETIMEADVVISKGIANFEAGLESWSMDGAGKVIVALRAKCGPIARLLGVKRGAPAVIKLASFMR